MGGQRPPACPQVPSCPAGHSVGKLGPVCSLPLARFYLPGSPWERLPRAGPHTGSGGELGAWCCYMDATPAPWISLGLSKALGEQDPQLLPSPHTPPTAGPSAGRGLPVSTAVPAPRLHAAPAPACLSSESGLLRAATQEQSPGQLRNSFPFKVSCLLNDSW